MRARSSTGSAPSAQRLCDLAEFHDIDAAFAGLDAPNEIIRFPEVGRKFTLAQPPGQVRSRLLELLSPQVFYLHLMFTGAEF
jgi:hypothetical protein